MHQHRINAIILIHGLCADLLPQAALEGLPGDEGFVMLLLPFLPHDVFYGIQQLDCGAGASARISDGYTRYLYTICDECTIS